MHHGRSRSALGALLLVLPLVAAACGGSGGSSSSTSSTASGTGAATAPAASTAAAATTAAAETTAADASSSAADTSAVASTEAQPVKQGGRLVIAAAQGIPQLDPYKILFQWEQVLYPLLWDTLTDYTPDGGTDVQPSLAESWEGSSDQKTWTFKLRSGVTFSDGTPLTAAAVVSSFKRALDPKTAFIWSFGLPKITDVAAPDDATVQFTLDKPNSTFPTAVSRVPVMLVDKLAQVDKNPIGTGRYVVKSFEPDNKVVLARNPTYWGDQPGPDEIEVTRAQDNTAAVTALRAGDIQALWSIPYSDVQQIEKENKGDITIVASANPASSIIIEVDNTSPPFDNVKARQALAYAVDKASIIEGVYAGKAIPSPANVPIPSSNPLFDATLPQIPYDLDKAKELFAEAGVKDGDTITYWTPAGQYGEWTTMGEVLQASLAEIGIKLDIKSAEISQWAAKFAPAGKKWPNMLVPNMYGGFPVPLTSIFWTPGICECNFDNADYNTAVADAGAASSDGIAAAYAKVQQVFAAQLPVVVVGHGDALIGVRSNITGVWVDPSGLPRLERASVG